MLGLRSLLKRQCLVGISRLGRLMMGIPLLLCSRPHRPRSGVSTSDRVWLASEWRLPGVEIG